MQFTRVNISYCTLAAQVNTVVGLVYQYMYLLHYVHRSNKCHYTISIFVFFFWNTTLLPSSIGPPAGGQTIGLSFQPSTSMLSVTLYVHSCLSPSFAFCFALFLLSAPLPPHLLITFSSLTRPSFQLKPTQTSGLRLTCPRSHDPHAGVGGTEGRKEIRRKRAE